MEEMQYNQNYDLYVTRDGNVYWKDYYGNLNIKQQHKTAKGYMYVIKKTNGARKKIKVHRLVAEAFIPNPDNKPQVDHINRVKEDNRAENLRWVTAKENLENRGPILKHRTHEFKEPYHSEFGRLFYQKHGISRRDDPKLYARERALYQYHGYI